jgi:hypothetical protein
MFEKYRHKRFVNLRLAVDKIQLAQERDHWRDFGNIPLGFNTSWVITLLLASVAGMCVHEASYVSTRNFVKP